MFTYWKLNILKKSVLHNVINAFNIIPIGLFSGNRQTDSKIYRAMRRTYNHRTILKENSTVRCTPSDFENHCKDTVLRAAWYWRNNKRRAQCDGVLESR